MISFLNGILADKDASPSGAKAFILDVNGVGYRVETSAISYAQAPAVTDPFKVYTSMIVREDSMQLVGFITREERELFDILSSASGVGLKVALAMMSDLTVAELAGAILASDFKRLTSVKGVGPKLAQKMTIELQDKMSKWHNESLQYAPKGDNAVVGKLLQLKSIQEAESVLISLGYSLIEVRQGLETLQSSESIETMTSEAVLQHLLKWLATHPAH